MSVMDSKQVVTAGRFAGRDPDFAAGMARIELHLARAHEMLARAERLAEEQERWEREQRHRRRLFGTF